MAGTDTVAALVAVAKTLTDAAKALTDLATSLNQAATTSPPVDTKPTPAPAKSTLTIIASADAGPATADILADGKKVGSIIVKADHKAGAKGTFTLQIDALPKTVTVGYNNDEWNAQGDRNLIVHSVTVNGTPFPAATAPGAGTISAEGVAIWANGSVDFSANGKATTASPTPVPTPSPGTGTTSPPTGSGTATTSPSATGKRPYQGKVQLGWIQGNGPPSIATMEQGALATWAPRVADYSLPYFGNANKSDFNSVGWIKGVYAGSVAKGRIFSAPILYSGIGLGDAVNSAELRASYKTIAQWIVANFPKDADGEYKVRNSWEYNGDWFPWHIKGNAGPWGALLAQLHVIMVDAYHEVSPAFRFIVNWNIGQDNPRFAFPDRLFNPAYTGASRMDTISYLALDFYTQPQWDGQQIDLSAATGVDGHGYFNFMRTRQFGLDDLVDLGDQTGKDIMIGEWGVTAEQVGRADLTQYVADAWAYFKANRFKAVCYWDSPAGDDGQLWNGKKPKIAAAMKAAIAAL